jgi:nucleotide-binding universal stress UspA family protein
VGDPGQVICEVAKSWDADLILMGRNRKSGISELFLGSSSNYVLHHAVCSVLVVQSTDTSATTTEAIESEPANLSGQ